LDKKRWQIEPFSKIQKESLKVVGVIVTHAKVVEGPGWNDINFTDTLPLIILLVRLGPDQSGGSVMHESFYSICQASITNLRHAYRMHRKILKPLSLQPILNRRDFRT